MHEWMTAKLIKHRLPLVNYSYPLMVLSFWQDYKDLK